MARKDHKGRNLRVGESQRADLLYMYRYTDPRTGKRETIYNSDLYSLREQERQIEKDIEDNIDVDPKKKKMTVNELFSRYIETRELKDVTRLNYISIWNHLVRNDLGSMKVILVKKSDVKLFYSRLSKEGLSHSTIKFVHNMLSPSFEFALDDDLIRKNPCRKTLGKYGKEAKEKMALTQAQQTALLSFVETSKTYNVYYPMFQILLEGGFRVGELIGLTWSDISMKKREVSVSWQLIYKNYGDGYKFHVERPKTDAGVRRVPMTNNVYKAFEAQKRLNFMRGVNRDYEIDGRKGFIFLSKNGRPLMPSAVNNVIYNIIDAYNKLEGIAAGNEEREPVFLPKISVHVFRHTCCTRMVERGMDLKAVQYVMGHSDLNVTLEVYTHITEAARIESEMTKMNAIAV